MPKGHPSDPSNQDVMFILVGKVVGAHGIDGDIKILPYGECEKKTWERVYLKRENSQEAYKVQTLKPHQRVLLVHLVGCDTRDNALTLVGSDVFINRLHLPKLPKGEYYYHDLVGMEVFTEDNILLGIIKDIFSTGSNDVYVVKNNLKEVLIPAIKDVVVDIDLNKKKMVIRLLEGLMP